MAFDIVPYGEVSVEEILKNIAIQAPEICKDIVIYESVTNNSEKSEEFRNLIGKSFDYPLSDLIPFQHLDLALVEKNIAKTSNESKEI